MIRELMSVVSAVREAVHVVRMLPSWSFLRAEYLTGVSARAWRNAIVSMLVGLIAVVGTVVVLRGVK